MHPLLIQLLLQQRKQDNTVPISLRQGRTPTMQVSTSKSAPEREWGKDSKTRPSWTEKGPQGMGKGRTHMCAVKRQIRSDSGHTSHQSSRSKDENLSFVKSWQSLIQSQQTKKDGWGDTSGTSVFVIPSSPWNNSFWDGKAWNRLIHQLIHHTGTYQEERHNLLLPDLPFSKQTTTNKDNVTPLDFNAINSTIKQ